jgi:DNA-directed RNA polymerase subunit L
LPLRRGRVTFKAFTKVSNAVEFTLNKEDHTLGNTLRMCAPRKESPANPLLPCR